MDIEKYYRRFVKKEFYVLQLVTLNGFIFKLKTMMSLNIKSVLI